jgi:O-antigen/teichoic acid export membrane protein
MSLAKSLIRSSGVSMMDHGVKMVAAFVMPPIMAKALGQEGYGGWLLVMAVVGYLTHLDLGLSFASTRFLAMALGAGNEARQAVIVAASRRFFRMMGVAAAILSLVALPVMPWLLAEHRQVGELTAVFAICGASMALRYFWRLPQMLLRAHLRYDLLGWASMLRTLLQLGVMSAVLLSGQGLLVAGIVHGLGDLLELLLQAVMSRRLKVPRAIAMARDEEQLLRKELLGYSGLIVLNNAGETFRQQVAPLIINRMWGAGSVPIYSVGLRLISMMEDVMNAIFGGPVLAAFSHLHGTGQSDKIREQFLRSIKVTTAFSTWALGGMVLFGETFLVRWMGEPFRESYRVMLLLVVPSALRFMQYPAYSVLYALGRQREMVLLNFVGGALALALSFPLGLRFGLPGIALGAALELSCAYGLVIPVLISRCIGINVWRYMLGHVLWPGVRACALPVAAGLYLRQCLTPDYGRFFLVAMAYAAVFAVTAPWTSLDASIREQLWRVIRRR